jgi:hypothetical protein
VLPPSEDQTRERPGQPYDKGWEGHPKDEKEYLVIHVRKDEVELPGKEEGRFVPEGRYLVDEERHPVYFTDTPINQKSNKMDNGAEAPPKYKAPQPQLFSIIIQGILGGKLEWVLIIAGALIAVSMELLGVSSLAVAVGMYLGLGTAVPIFFGGMLRWLTDRRRGAAASEAETETSPGVLLASGYIAGGTLIGLAIGFFRMSDTLTNGLNLGHYFGDPEKGPKIDDLTKAFWGTVSAKLIAVATFFVLAAVLYWIGSKKSPELNSETGPPEGAHAQT